MDRLQSIKVTTRLHRFVIKCTYNRKFMHFDRHLQMIQISQSALNSHTCAVRLAKIYMLQSNLVHLNAISNKMAQVGEKFYNFPQISSQFGRNWVCVDLM